MQAYNLFRGILLILIMYQIWAFYRLFENNFVSTTFEESSLLRESFRPGPRKSLDRPDLTTRISNTGLAAIWHQPVKREGNQNETPTEFKDADGNQRFTRKVNQFNTDFWDFAQTQTEKEAGWLRRAHACGSNRNQRQQNDTSCPNVIIINTDDLSWADVSINNPSKVVPTPNLDRLVSKGINFRDGHSCTSRCAPSRFVIQKKMRFFS